MQLMLSLALEVRISTDVSCRLVTAAVKTALVCCCRWVCSVTVGASMSSYDHPLLVVKRTKQNQVNCRQCLSSVSLVCATFCFRGLCKGCKAAQGLCNWFISRDQGPLAVLKGICLASPVPASACLSDTLCIIAMRCCLTHHTSSSWFAVTFCAVCDARLAVYVAMTALVGQCT